MTPRNGFHKGRVRAPEQQMLPGACPYVPKRAPSPGGALTPSDLWPGPGGDRAGRPGAGLLPVPPRGQREEAAAPLAQRAPGCAPSPWSRRGSRRRPGCSGGSRARSPGPAVPPRSQRAPGPAGAEVRAGGRAAGARHSLAGRPHRRSGSAGGQGRTLRGGLRAALLPRCRSRVLPGLL